MQFAAQHVQTGTLHWSVILTRVPTMFPFRWRVTWAALLTGPLTHLTERQNEWAAENGIQPLGLDRAVFCCGGALIFALLLPFSCQQGLSQACHGSVSNELFSGLNSIVRRGRRFLDGTVSPLRSQLMPCAGRPARISLLLTDNLVRGTNEGSVKTREQQMLWSLSVFSWTGRDINATFPVGVVLGCRLQIDSTDATDVPCNSEKRILL